MNLKENLLTHYLLAIEMVKDAEDWYRVLTLMEVGHGVCSCSLHVFHEGIWHAEWVAKYCDDGRLRDCRFWGPLPWLGPTKKEALARLQIRVNNLIKEIYG